MQKKGRTIYQTARLYTDFTQESASERLNISCKSIGAYERGETIPPDEIVIAMVELYHTPWLPYMHLKLNNAVAKKYLPDIQLRDLSSSILDLQVEMDNTNKVQLGMATIGRDNIVDKHEETEWEKYMANLKSLGGALFSVVFSPIQKEKSPVLVHRRFEY
ncbi:helix-turn-helix domain-containing protein [Pelosinus baikalensis]|uniref:Helix-turn-helix transcriptional regulator n=1 Tax=Pelosinus baikalensis TaxID=2892015 RepID=A0ABS8HZW3_9FIRM|nr:helix-turn-helix transcriptional regulator [Pelosinus baikalensis]MCC5467657.1 helix-turn-helix transcriptional regulator [Pelosinus baikalensis]